MSIYLMAFIVYMTMLVAATICAFMGDSESAFRLLIIAWVAIIVEVVTPDYYE